MKTFHLYERPDGRIVLADKKEKASRLIRDIKAENWKAARATIPENEFFHDPGHGWFETPRSGAYKRSREYHDRVIADQLRLALLLRENDLDKRAGRRATAPDKHKAGKATDHLFA